MPQKKLEIATHLLTHSYEAVGDPKILLSALRNVLDAIEMAITESLEKARKNHEIPPYGDTFNGKLTSFKMHLAKKKGITPMDFMMISELQELLIEQQRAPVEFRRKTAFVIADDDYHLRTITPEKTKTYIQRARSIISRT